MTDPGKKNIALVTDFGHKDVFVGILKGVISSISPGASVIDLSHEVAPQDILHGSFFLSVSAVYFPRGTIFCVVVDPGVGSDRRAVLVKTKDYYFVGPDNGVLWQTAAENGIEQIIHLTQPRYFLETVSATFHGRDIFAPVAAHLSLGLEIEKFGDPATSLTPFEFPGPVKQDNCLILTVLHIDTYGNIILNITQDEFDCFMVSDFCLSVNHTCITPFFETYAAAEENTPFVMVSSSGYMEIAVKNKNAAQILGVERLDQITLSQP